jgi:hypothetical protein
MLIIWDFYGEVKMALHPIIALDNVIRKYRDYLQTEFPAKDPELCLAKLDELKSIGLEAFTKKYDPYWDFPLNENLPLPDPVVSAAIAKFLGSADWRKPGGIDDQKSLHE